MSCKKEDFQLLHFAKRGTGKSAKTLNAQLLKITDKTVFEQICTDQLEFEWNVANVFPKIDGLILGGCLPSTIQGFLMYNLHSHPGSLYIDLICSSANGVGKQMIEESFKIAKGLGLNYVTLSALPEVILYYRRLGFVNADTKQDLKKAQEESTISTAFDKLDPDVKARIRGRRSALESKSFNKILALLVKKQLVSTKSCLEKKGQKDKIETCAEDGFTMIKCLDGSCQPVLEKETKTEEKKKKPTSRDVYREHEKSQLAAIEKDVASSQRTMRSSKRKTNV